MSYKYIVSLFILFAPAIAFCAPQEIRVELSTQKKLTPLYISNFDSDNSVPAGYEKQLQEILEKDFKYNGSSQLLPKDPKKELVVREKEQLKALNRLFWKEAGTSQLIAASIQKGFLNVRAFDVLTGVLKQYREVKLSGNLNQDRRQIHRLADAIHFAFFNTEGIASTRILYSYYLPEQTENSFVAEIWECDWDGENRREITHEGSYCVSPVYVPGKDGGPSDSFLYVSYKQGQPKIYKASLSDGKGQRVVDIRGNQLLPAITPGKDKIAFICDATGRADLFLIESAIQLTGNETPKQLYSFPRSTQASPTFSPDGNTIAFVSDKDGSPRIYTISAKSSKTRAAATLLTKRVREATSPSFSPDGKKLVYSAKVENVRQIWIYDFEAGEEKQLTTGPGNKENPSFAPDSLHIIFNSVDNDSSELYIVNTNQPEAIRITSGPGKKHYPAWGRTKA